MTAPTPDANPVPTMGKGVTAEAMRLLGSLTQHLQALGALAGLEGKEALTHFLWIAILVGAALFFAAFGYVFLILLVAFGIVALFHVDWLWVTLGLAVLHLLFALICGLIVKSRFRTPVFRGTLEEIRKDAATLRGTPATPSVTP